MYVISRLSSCFVFSNFFLSQVSCCVHVLVYEVILFSKLNINNCIFYSQAEVRQSSAGLGSRGSSYSYGVGDDYKSNVLAMTQARYRDTL